MFQCILFDIDGTILDTKYASLLSTQVAFSQLMGTLFSLDELEYSFGITTLSAARHYGCKDEDAYCTLVDALYEKYGAKYNRVFPGMQEVLEELHYKKIPLGIATSKTQWEYDHDFDLYGLKKYFIHPVTADDTLEHKPYPAPVNEFVARSGIPKGSILYVGDMIHDYLCASRAGVAFAFAGWSDNSPIPEADYVLQSPISLLDFV